MNPKNHNPNQQARTAAAWLKDDPLFLDTETTGLDSNAEVVEVSIIDRLGNTLLDTLVKPVNPIPEEATAIHGITNNMVANAPAWPEIHDNFYQIIEGRRLVIYNREYDERIIEQTVRLYDSFHNDHSFDSLLVTSCCAMQLYSAHYGQWDDRHQNWKWKKLTDAAEHMEVSVHGKAHRALADCRMTLGVVQAMADSLPTAEASDGYHTFSELYEHRHWLWINFLHENAYDAFKTRLNDKGDSLPGWFIAGINTPQGQMTYHLPERLWQNLEVPEVERNADYDGHSSQDVLKRLEVAALEKLITY